MTTIHSSSSETSPLKSFVIPPEMNVPLLENEEVSTLGKIIGITGLILALLGLAIISTVEAKDLFVSGTAMSLGGSFIALCGFQNLFQGSENYLSFLYNRVRHLDF